MASMRDFLVKTGNSLRNLSNLRFTTKGYTQTTSRPAIMQPYMATDTGAKLPIFPYPLIMIYELADNVDALRIPIETLNREIFKNGYEVVEKFKYKCEKCFKEFEYKPVKQEKGKNNDGLTLEQENNLDDSNLECDSCGNNKLIRPEPENRKVLQKLYTEFVNNNDQTIDEVARQLERDLEVADNAYMLILKNYNYNGNTGEIIHEKTKIKEIMRIDPPEVAMIADSDGRIGFDDKRIPVFVCPFFEHRDKRLTSHFCDRLDEHHSIPIRALRAVAEVSSVYSIGLPQPKRVIYGEGEIIWKAGKYKPGLIYGFSPIYAIWSKVMALSHMDEYIRKYFDKMRPPRGLLVVASRNYETFRKAWGALEEKAIEDPYMIHPLMVESEKGGRNMAQWIDFTGSLKELEFINIRKELRMIIGAIYGVLPLYFGELPSGWSQEGMQVTITNRAVKWGQDILKKSFFDRLAVIMGVNDWELKLKAGEEVDKLRELQIDSQEIQNMSGLQAMGFPVERTHQGNWKVGKTPTFEQMPIEGIGRGPSLTGNKEQVSDFQGQPPKRRPSDPGGQHEGSPSSGPNTSLSAKACVDMGIIPSKGHSLAFWVKKFNKHGYSDKQVSEILSGWSTKETKSGTLYYPVTSDDIHPAQNEKPHFPEETHRNIEITEFPEDDEDGKK